MAWIAFTSSLVILFHTLGCLSALHAIRYARTSQSAIAWALCLVLFPYFTLFFYWVFSPKRYYLYLDILEQERAKQHAEGDAAAALLTSFAVDLPEPSHRTQQVVQSLFPFPPLGSHRATLLIDGKATFQAILNEIARAQHFILVQFYIVRDDAIGQAFRDALIKKQREGVRVYFLFDSIGSVALPDSYIRTLADGGVQIASFRAPGGILQRFSLNFRNHRKVVVTDGCCAFVGGHNLGDEYLGRTDEYPSWRDTHIKVTGAAALAIQQTFLEDWYFATGDAPTLPLPERKVLEAGEITVLPVPTGPESALEGCSLLFIQALNEAKERFWISSPYFVPSEAVIKALQLASFRGVDVRILLPDKADQVLVWLASYSYLEVMLASGVRVYRYQEGFLHQKVFVVDDSWCSVGTVNLDNRSLRLNFELTVLVFDHAFTQQVSAMLEVDFGASRRIDHEELESLSLPMRTASAVARLFSPVL